jgi:hypothetical protein
MGSEQEEFKAGEVVMVFAAKMSLCPDVIIQKMDETSEYR